MKNRRSKYTRELLAPIVAASVSFSEVMRRLGLSETGGNFRNIKARILSSELSTDHFRRCKRPDYSRDELEPIVEESSSVKEVLEKLGLNTNSGTLHRHIGDLIDELGISMQHFPGRAWNRGKTAETDPRLRRVSEEQRLPDEEVFIENSTYKTSAIARRLLLMGWENRCAKCGINEWRGKPLRLHLDHRNGVHSDNRLENLRFLCPNCHSQTETYCGKNRGKTKLGPMLELVD